MGASASSSGGVRDAIDVARFVFPIRHIAVAAMIPLVLVLPGLEESEALAAYCLFVVLPADLLLGYSTRKRGRLPLLQPAAFGVLGAAAVLIEPAAYPAVAVLVITDLALSAVMLGRGPTIVGGGFGLTVLAAGVVAGDVPDPWLVYVALVGSALALALILGAIADEEASLRLRYRALVDDVDVVVWEMVPGTGRFTYVSPRAEELLGFPVDDWYSPGFWEERVHPDDVARVCDEVDIAIASGSDHVLEYRMVAMDGHTVHVRDAGSMERDAAGRTVNMRGVMMDVSDRRRAEEDLRQQATHDSLTGLTNRALLVNRLDIALQESRGTGDSVALLLLDLDDFKEVNDTLGHQAGDSLLVALAHRLRDDLGDCDTVARLGGDEFAILLTTFADEGVAVAAAKRVHDTLERPFEVGGLLLQCSASIGIALSPEHADDVDTLIARADIAMYLAKRSGRPWAVYESALDATSVRRLTLLGQLRRAIATDELDLEFQPCFDLLTRRAVAVEALVRWTHPDRGRVEPADFIRLAEVSGLIQPLSRWVVEHAIEHQQSSGTDLQLSVNLSVRNLAESDLVGWLDGLLAATGFPAERLVLELTESEVMSDVGAAIEVLQHLRALGVGLAIDDFGTGRSALAYLKSLPIDELKIDRAFVTGIANDDRDAAICGSIIDLAHRLGLRVVAEGPATLADVEALQRLGCDRAQGHCLGSPVGPEGLAALARRTVRGAAGDVPGSVARR